jgi:hypothetical protein
LTGDPFESPFEFIERVKNSPAGRGAVGRREVERLAQNDPVQALQVARSIDHPWYRCQAIASIVEVNPSAESAEDLLDEAFAAAYSQDEPNRVASVSLWPLRLLVNRGSSKATVRTEELLKEITREPHGLRKLMVSARFSLRWRHSMVCEIWFSSRLNWQQQGAKAGAPSESSTTSSRYSFHLTELPPRGF